MFGKHATLTPPQRILTLCALLLFLGTRSQQKVDIAIIGGGAGGTSAAIQAARMGASVCILEPTPWLGGMLTAAGVSAIDGNHNMPSGIWGEFREALYNHYGGPKAVATGWVSHTLFEPSVGNNILQKMTTIPFLEKKLEAQYRTIRSVDGGWAVSYQWKGREHQLWAKILMDATETGELLPLVGAAFRLGMDAASDTGEKEAPPVANSMVQDMTYVALLKDVGASTSKKGLVKKPKAYHAEAYACACNREGGEMFGAVSDCQQMLDYGKLPNDKYMINWPNCGNDYYLDWPTLDAASLENELENAKQFTLGFVHYIQEELGFQNLRLEKVFPTKDGLPLLPYHREGRRVKGKVFFTKDHMAHPYAHTLYRTGIAVGDYPIDHHHDKNPEAPEIDFITIQIPSYTIPLGALVPESVPQFLVAEKNISVSNIANGTTRLQPVVLGIGQAAGALAALSVTTGVAPHRMAIREVQGRLLQDGVYLMPFIDTLPSDVAFGAMQRMGATGVLKGYGVPYKWANETWFYPERQVSEFEWINGITPFYPEVATIPASGKGLTLSFIKTVLQQTHPDYAWEKVEKSWASWNIPTTYQEDIPLDRRTTSILTDQLLDPFAFGIDINGALTSKK